MVHTCNMGISDELLYRWIVISKYKYVHVTGNVENHVMITIPNVCMTKLIIKQ